jgi:hypothetical protein
MDNNSNNNDGVVNYPLLVVNAGVIDSISIFFALSGQVPT